jgi:hypothetical protein
MDVISVSVLIEEIKISDAMIWCVDNNILITRHKMLHSENTFGRGIIYGCNFYFTNNEDAAAFKLRWS